jgi:hypothetical protein
MVTRRVCHDIHQLEHLQPYVPHAGMDSSCCTPCFLFVTTPNHYWPCCPAGFSGVPFQTMDKLTYLYIGERMSE